MRTWKVILTALALTAALSGCQTNNQQVESKYISMEQAQSNALHAAQIDAADAVMSSTTLEDTHGITCYKVEFTANGSDYIYSVHAETGEIIEASFHDADIADGETEDHAQNTDANVSPENGDQASAADSAVTTFPSASSIQNALNSTTTVPAAQNSNTAKQQITESAAKEAALKHAGVKTADATFVKIEPDWEDGRLVYEIEFVVPSGSSCKEYDYEIDAYTAAIVSYDYDIEASYTPPASGSGTGSGATITEASAKKTALAQVPGATEAKITKFKLDEDDGRWEYAGEIL